MCFSACYNQSKEHYKLNLANLQSVLIGFWTHIYFSTEFDLLWHVHCFNYNGIQYYSI